MLLERPAWRHRQRLTPGGTAQSGSKQRGGINESPITKCSDLGARSGPAEETEQACGGIGHRQRMRLRSQRPCQEQVAGHQWLGRSQPGRIRQRPAKRARYPRLAHLPGGCSHHKSHGYLSGAGQIGVRIRVLQYHESTRVARQNEHKLEQCHLRTRRSAKVKGQGRFNLARDWFGELCDVGSPLDGRRGPLVRPRFFRSFPNCR